MSISIQPSPAPGSTRSTSASAVDPSLQQALQAANRDLRDAQNQLARDTAEQASEETLQADQLAVQLAQAAVAAAMAAIARARAEAQQDQHHSARAALDTVSREAAPSDRDHQIDLHL